MSRSVSTNNILLSSHQFFLESVEEALEKRKIKTFPLAVSYLVDLLNFYIHSSNLFEKESKMLAETFLESTHLSRSQKKDSLKKLGDTSLYIGGFFGDSLKKKVVDIDYYIDMGEAAYGNLATVERNNLKAKVYDEYSNKFSEFIDVLTYISQKFMVQSNSDLLRLYDRYINTGSVLAKEQLIEKGLLNSQIKKNKLSKN